MEVFASFWMSGFEGADHGADPAGHLLKPGEDYARLRQFGIRTVRESIAWRGDQLDTADVLRRAEAARAQGLQVIWTLCDETWPEGLDLFSEDFPVRFGQHAARAAAFLRSHTEGAPVYVPINEPSYRAWISCRERSDASACTRTLRRQFGRAAILACEAILQVDPRARFVHTDPVLLLAPATDDQELERACAEGFEDQFYVWDLVSGSLEPELGGDSRYLDCIGVNYYQSNQSEAGSGKPLAWQLDDPRRATLAMLLQSVYERYGKAMIIAETGHRGVRRGPWIREVAEEVRKVRAQGVPVEGICLYPAIDRPDRDNPARWLNCGLWDLDPAKEGPPLRRLNARYAQALREAQLSLSAEVEPPAEFPQYSTAPGNAAKASSSAMPPRTTS